MRREVRLEEFGSDKVTEATVSFWYFDVDEAVKQGDDLVEIVTDKATYNVSSPVAGTLSEIRSGEGQVVKPGDLLCVIETKE